MKSRRTSPLRTSTIEKHQCSESVRLEKLGMVPFFQGLDRKAIGEINEKFSAAHFEAGHTIYHEGAKATQLRVVVYGAVKLIRNTEEGKELLMEMLKAGEYCGSLNEMGDDTYNETAVAQSDACILSIGNREFRSILNTYPSIAVAVLDITANRLNTARKQIHHLSSLSVEKRIAHILLRLGEKFGEKDRVGMLLQLPLSRKDLADMAGTSSETASRIMSQFQQDGIITSGRQWVAIKDYDKLSTVVPET